MFVSAIPCSKQSIPVLRDLLSRLTAGGTQIAQAKVGDYALELLLDAEKRDFPGLVERTTRSAPNTTGLRRGNTDERRVGDVWTAVATGATTFEEVCAATGLHLMTVRRYVKHLIETGRLRTEKAGRGRRLALFVVDWEPAFDAWAALPREGRPKLADVIARWGVSLSDPGLRAKARALVEREKTEVTG